ncbi:hypothetical protein HAX54_015835, partial [Datura stramonium]|nr:hypothetical protein [Datura stramonium]
MGEVTTHHTSGWSDSHLPHDRFSPVSSRSGPSSLRATELAIDYQRSDGSSLQPSPRPRFPCNL